MDHSRVSPDNGKLQSRTKEFTCARTKEDVMRLVVKCTTENCCNGNYHCPLCSRLRPTKPGRVRSHIESTHWKNHIRYHGLYLLRCYDMCRSKPHYHCSDAECTKTLINKEDLLKHLRRHAAHPEEEANNELTQTKTQHIHTDQEYKNVDDTSDDQTEALLSNAEPSRVYQGPCLGNSIDKEEQSENLQTEKTESEIKMATSKSSLSNNEEEETHPPAYAEQKTAVPKLLKNQAQSSQCSICWKNISKSNMKRHMKIHDNEIQIHQSTCVDAHNGIYLVNKCVRGRQDPVHVQNKNWGAKHHVECADKECRDAKKVSITAGRPGFVCQHVQATQGVWAKSVDGYVSEITLDQCVGNKLINGAVAKTCMEEFRRAQVLHVPLISEMSLKKHTSERYMFFSVLTDGKHHWALLGRVVTKYDTLKHEMHCNCCNYTLPCVHKAMTVWFLMQHHPSVLHREHLTPNDADTASNETDTAFNDAATLPDTEKKHVSEKTNTVASDDVLLYPPQNEASLTKMVNYLHNNKKQPYIIPNEAISIQKGELKRAFKPTETHCHDCGSQLSPDILITKKANILTMDGVIDNVQVYCRQCPSCGNIYRYQEHVDGVFNYNDRLLLSQKMCLHLRCGLQNHVAIGRSLATLRSYIHGRFPPDHDVINAYAVFEALTDRKYDYFCCKCGHHPTILVFDLCRKTSFDINVSDIPKPDVSSYKDNVNISVFWKQLSCEIIARGLISDGVVNPFEVKPDFSFWGPWIGENTRIGNDVLNTEYMKITQPNDMTAAGLDPTVIDADTLADLVSTKKRKDIVDICKSCNINTRNRSILDLLVDLQQCLSRNSHYAKVFRKVFGSSGGVATGSCVHGIVYAVKFVLRSEGVRDYTDLLLSFKYPPNLTIIDMPHMLATHTNLRRPLFFHPFEGKLCQGTEESIELGKQERLSIDIPWLDEPQENDGPDSHPETGSSTHLCLSDAFHEDNSRREDKVLRQTKHVPQLNGINTQVQEQLFSQTTKDDYFLNNMSSSNHMFLFRTIVDDLNIKRNADSTHKMERALRRELTLTAHGKLTVADEEGSDCNAQNQNIEESLPVKEQPIRTSVPPVSEAEATHQSDLMSDLLQIVGQAVEGPVPENVNHITEIEAKRTFWTKPLFTKEVEMVHAVFDRTLTENEPIVTVCGTILTRSDMQTLLPAKNVECRIINACFATICAVASAKGKLVGYIDGYVIPTWLRNREDAPILEDILPGYKDLEKILIPVYRPGHWCLAIIDIQHMTVWYLNPLYFLSENRGNASPSEDDLLRRIIRLNFEMDDGVALEHQGWEFKTGWDEEVLPAQYYGSDCGIFIIMYALYKALEESYDFSVHDMTRLRIWLVLVLIENYEVRSSRGDIEYVKFAPWSQYALTGEDPMPGRWQILHGIAPEETQYDDVETDRKDDNDTPSDATEQVNINTDSKYDKDTPSDETEQVNSNTDSKDDNHTPSDETEQVNINTDRKDDKDTPSDATEQAIANATSNEGYTLRQRKAKKRPSSWIYATLIPKRRKRTNKKDVADNLDSKSTSDKMDKDVDCDNDIKGSCSGEANDTSFPKDHENVPDDLDKQQLSDHVNGKTNDDSEDDVMFTANTSEGITIEFCKEHIETLKTEVINTMSCDKEGCLIEQHGRHHKFTRQPLDMYRLHRRQYCYGVDEMDEKLLEWLTLYLRTELLYFDVHPRHPYTRRALTLNGTKPNSQLATIFQNHKLIANMYVDCVCLKHVVATLVSQFRGIPFEEADAKCMMTEIDKVALVKGTK